MLTSTVPSIVALLSNGCKQAFPLLTYSVHVTIYIYIYYFMINTLINEIIWFCFAKIPLLLYYLYMIGNDIFVI
jgi:hypothetical protein